LIELRFPERAIALDPFDRAAHRRRGEARMADSPGLLDMRETGALQNTHVLRDGRQRHREAGRELADRDVACRQTGQNLAARWISQREERGVERLGTVNHMV
jgi:hypothetical protein